MGKRKGNTKVKDSHHSRKQSRDHGSSSQTNSSMTADDETNAETFSSSSGTKSRVLECIFFLFRILHIFVTKYLPYVCSIYLTLLCIVLAYALFDGDIRNRIEIKPILRRGPSALLRQARRTLYDSFFFRREVPQFYYSFTPKNEGFATDPNKRALLFAVLREAIVREPGGYVHPDLGILQPAPSGAVRGIGMIRGSYHQCQSECFPGNDSAERLHNSTRYKQQDILIRVPLSYQMTRKVAVETLVPLLPSPDKAVAMADLDDPTMLVLLLAHERSKTRYSHWHAYIASLPPQPTCGYWRESRSQMLQSLAHYRQRFQIDADGWEDELYKATEYSETIVRQLSMDYGPYLFQDTNDTSTYHRRIAWALCQVASRATAGYGDHGNLRLIPMLDMINHDLHAGGFLELTGKETIANGDPLNAKPTDEGTFIVRSLRHGRRKPLKLGQELMVNYNVPNYSPLDWFVSMGFVPPERRSPWIKVDPVLPNVRDEGGATASEQIILEREKRIEAKLKELNL